MDEGGGPQFGMIGQQERLVAVLDRQASDGTLIFVGVADPVVYRDGPAGDEAFVHIVFRHRPVRLVPQKGLGGLVQPPSDLDQGDGGKRCQLLSDTHRVGDDRQCVLLKHRGQLQGRGRAVQKDGVPVMEKGQRPGGDKLFLLRQDIFPQLDAYIILHPAGAVCSAVHPDHRTLLLQLL